MPSRQREPAAPAARCAEAPRVLLVEFINADQFPGQVSRVMPFILGYLGVCGVPARWLRFGIRTDNLFRHGRDEVTLEPAEFQRLAEVSADLAATVVLATHPLAAEHVRALQEARAGLPVLPLRHDLPDLGLMAWLPASAAAPSFAFPTILDDPRFGVADYRFVPGNAAAARIDRHNVYLVQPDECGYHRPVALNPCYADVDLSTTRRDHGCAFCGHAWPPDSRAPDAAADGRTERWIVRQIQDIQRTLGPAQAPAAVMLESIRLVGLLDLTVDTLRACGLGRTAVLFGARVDQLLAARTALRARLAAARPDDPVLHLATIGLENFVDAELLRLHKGHTGLAVCRVVNLLKELTAEYPLAFHYAGYMALSFILFTPWTTLADLKRNLRLIQHFELEEEIGNLFLSRLRLHADLAITALARRDGLLVAAASADLRLNRRKLFQHEHPWRFQDPRVEPVNRIAVRLEGGQSFAGDALHDRLHERLAAWPGDGRSVRRRLVAALLAVVEAAAQAADPLDPAVLVDRACAALEPAAPPAAAAGPARFRLGLASLTAAEWLARLVPLVAAGLKPAASLDGLSAAERATLDCAALDRLGLPYAVVAESGAATLYVANAAPALARLVALHPVLRAGGPAADDARAEAGRLFGYPDCCVTAWLRNPWREVGATGHAQLLCRLADPGPAPAAALPLGAPGLAFVPCGPRCAAAHERLAAWQAALDPSLAALWAADPLWLFPLGVAPDELAGVVPLERGERTVRYDPRAVRGAAGPIAAALRQGDCLRFEPGELQVWHDARRVAQWVADVGCIDPAAAADEPFWRELGAAALRRCDPVRRAAARRAAALSADLALDRQSAAGRLAASRVQAQPVAPPAAATAVAGPAEGLRLVFRSQAAPATRFEFTLAPLAPGAPAFARSGAYGLVHAPCPTDAAFERIGAFLRAVLQRYALPARGPLPAAYADLLRRLFERAPLAARFMLEIRGPGAVAPPDPGPGPAPLGAPRPA